MSLVPHTANILNKVNILQSIFLKLLHSYAQIHRKHFFDLFLLYIHNVLFLEHFNMLVSARQPTFQVSVKKWQRVTRTLCKAMTPLQSWQVFDEIWHCTTNLQCREPS